MNIIHVREGENMIDANFQIETVIDKPGYGKYNEKDEFALSEAEAQNLHKLFNQLFLNKLQHYKRTIKEEKDKQKRYKPKLGAATLKIAQDIKQKRSETFAQKNEYMMQKNNNPSTADLLIAEKSQLEMNRAKSKQKVEAEKLKECTFHPMINLLKSLGNSKSRCQSLYNLSRPTKKKVSLVASLISITRFKINLLAN